MTDPFVAEILMLGCSFAPRGFARCDGQLLPISQNTALFSLLGTMYGGDGRTTFALPDLRAAAPLGTGQGTGLSQRDTGETGGSPFVTLVESELPAHRHAVSGRGAAGLPPHTSPTNNLWAGTNDRPYVTPANAAASPTSMAASALATAGGSLPHNNMMPYLAVTMVIALQGVYPPRS